MKKIIHIDADCFFAAVELLRKPHLVGLPVAVGGDPSGRGVISTCNYIARAYGVKSAMPSSHARRLCPDLVFLSPDIPMYRFVSKQMHEIFSDYTDCLESVSLDEAYLDVTDSAFCGGSATLIAREIQHRVKRELGLTVSAGVAPIKFVAKVASDWRKPAGIFTVTPEALSRFVACLDLRRLPGVGPKTWQKLSYLGLQTCADILIANPSQLYEHFGSYAHRLIEMSQGQDHHEIAQNRTRKSISVEHTFGADYQDAASLISKLPGLLMELDYRMRASVTNHVFHKRMLKLKFSDFTHTSIEARILKHGSALTLIDFERMCYIARSRNSLPVRLMGIGLKINPSVDIRQLEFAFG